ncbi:unnamed protein product [Auanema sp. JU1783]|nr:unnamed protein product [Auanema sp. JU1783]
MFLEDCKEHFGCDGLYDVLGITSEASLADVKKGYYKLSMKWHPDKAGQSENDKKDATTKFQLISKAYEILSDKSRRALYDETGAIDDELGSSDFETAMSLWRKVFKKVSKKDIDSYLTKYRGSEEELDDIVKTFERFNGNVDKMMNYLVGADNEQEPRILELIDSLINEGKLEKTADYTRTSSEKSVNARKKKAKKEETAAAKIEKKNPKESLSLEEMILARQQNRSSVFDQIAEKYAKTEKPKRKAVKKEAPKAKKSKRSQEDE